LFDLRGFHFIQRDFTDLHFKCDLLLLLAGIIYNVISCW